MKKLRFLCLLTVLLLVASPGPLLRGEEPEKTTAGLTVGVWDSIISGSPERVAEYDPDGAGALAEIVLETVSPGAHLLLKAHGNDGSSQGLKADLDARRMVRFTVDYFKLPHRLSHDPLDYMNAVASPKVLQGTDAAPSAEYKINYSRMESRLEFRNPSWPQISGGITAMDQRRTGQHQSLTLGHCSGCHVAGQTRQVDERTSDLGAFFQVSSDPVTARLSYSRRTLRQAPDDIYRTFDKAEHPVQRTPIFGNRVQYEVGSGPLPVDLQRETTKDTLRLDLTAPDAGGFALEGGGLWIRTENDRNDLRQDYSGYRLNAARALGKKWSFKWRANYYDIDSSDHFVDTAEPVTLAGPQAGQTYRDAYGLNPDFWRTSAADRQVFKSDLDLRYSMGKRAGYLGFYWNYRDTDRTYQTVLGDSNRTRSNQVGITWRARPWKGSNLRAEYEHLAADHTFGNPNGSCTTLTAPANPSALAAMQYYVWRAGRVADPTASPDRADRLRVNLTQAFGPKTTLTASAHWWSGRNTEGDLTDWSKDQISATLSIYSAPTTRFEWYANAAYLDYSLNLPPCINLMDG